MNEGTNQNENIYETINIYNGNIVTPLVYYYSTINSFINDISKVVNTNHGVNTQLTSNAHESIINGTISDVFNTDNSINKVEFRKFIKNNGRNWCGNNNPMCHSCEEYILITNNSLNLIPNKNYLILQPGGPQNYPDSCLIKLDNNNRLQMSFIECKQKKPKFNNNPPKRKKNCIYICGNKIYNGYLLTTPEWQEKYNNYVGRYRELINEFRDTEFRPSLYKVVELNWVNGPICFTEREEQNIPLITQCLSRFI
jgi:hypothetical protein